MEGAEEEARRPPLLELVLPSMALVVRAMEELETTAREEAVAAGGGGWWRRRLVAAVDVLAAAERGEHGRGGGNSI
jgi:hypothetical protein